MRKIAVCLTKGGVAKTTTAVHLAVGLGAKGKKVLLADVDSQGQTAFFLGLMTKQEAAKSPRSGVADVLMEYINNGEAAAEKLLTSSLLEVRPNVSLLAGGRKLALAAEFIRSSPLEREYTMSRALAGAGDMGFDYLILDVAPGWEIITINSLICVKEIVCPVTMELAAIESLADFTNLTADVQRVNHDLKISYILPTRLDRRSKTSSMLLDGVAKQYPQQICEPIGASVRFSEAVGAGQTIWEYAPDTPGAGAYQAFVDKVYADSEKMMEEK